jgi:NADH-quinone oxidoreductase subunit N
MYMQPVPEGSTPVPADGIQSATLALLALLTIVLGIVPGFLSGIL